MDGLLIYPRAGFSPRIESEREISGKLKDGERVKTKLRVKNLSNNRLKIEVLENLPAGFKAERPSLFLDAHEVKEVEYFITPVGGIFRLKDPMIRAKALRGLYYEDFMRDSESAIEIEVYPNR